MNILITGSKGFIGSNIKSFLKLETNHIITEHNRTSSKKTLIQKLKKTDIILHLGGENRSNNSQNFYKNNYQLTKDIVDNIKTKTHIIFASTVKVKEKSIYGKSKKKAEGILKQFCNEKKYILSILRLPNVFGKWGRPNHNSVVATYCHNSSRNIKSKINDPETVLDLLYIDDLISQIMSIIKNKKKIIYPKIKLIHKIKLKTLHQKIYSINKNRIKLNIDLVKTKIDKQIYSTYLTYLSNKQFTLSYKKNLDKRGNFSELTKSKINGQTSYFTINPGHERGNHLHFSKVEKFFPIFGSGKIVYKNINNKKKITFKYNSNEARVFEAIPGWSHKFINNTKSIAIIIVWANEIFDKKNPDTYYYKI